MKTLGFTIISLLLLIFFDGNDRRSRVLLIDSGVDKTGVEKFFCEDGHFSFQQGKHSDPFVDATGHGTAMAYAMVEHLNPAKQCIVVYKTFHGGDPLEKTEAYMYALLKASKEDFVAVSIALEDVGYYSDEVRIYKTLTKRSRVFIAAGNGGKNLYSDCSIYPACLALKVNSKNFRVVGSIEGNFNRGGPINEYANSEINILGKRTHGTSVSTARAAAIFAARKIKYTKENQYVQRVVSEIDYRHLQ